MPKRSGMMGGCRQAAPGRGVPDRDWRAAADAAAPARRHLPIIPDRLAPPPEAAPVLGARPAFWPGQDPRSSQDQPGPPRPTAIKIIIGTGEAILTAIGAPPRMLRPLPGNTPEAAPVLGARPAFWPGQDPRSSQDQPGPPRPTAIKIIIGTGEAILTAIGAPPQARWFPLGGMQRAMPGLLISSRCLAPTRPPGPCTAA